MARRVAIENSNEITYNFPAAAVVSRSPPVTPTRTPGTMLHPPPDIRCIVDKTAEFVAQNGVEFEQKILSIEKRNPTFNFLKSKDPYHSYYQRRILEFIDKEQQSPRKTVKQDKSDSR